MIYKVRVLREGEFFKDWEDQVELADIELPDGIIQEVVEDQAPVEIIEEIPVATEAKKVCEVIEQPKFELNGDTLKIEGTREEIARIQSRIAAELFLKPGSKIERIKFIKRE